MCTTFGRVEWPPTKPSQPHKAKGHFIRLSHHDPFVSRVDLVSHHKKKINQEKQNKMATERGIGRGIGRLTGREGTTKRNGLTTTARFSCRSDVEYEMSVSIN
jgi:hypothetical protein